MIFAWCCVQRTLPIPQPPHTHWNWAQNLFRYQSVWASCHWCTKSSQVSSLYNTNVLFFRSEGHKRATCIPGLKSRCRLDCAPSARSREDSISLSFWSARTPWLMASSSIFKALHLSVSFFCSHIFLSLSCLPCPLFFSLSTFKDLCDYIGPTWIIQGHLHIWRYLITPTKSLLPYQVTHSRY